MKANKRVFIFLIVPIIVISLSGFTMKGATSGQWSPDQRVPGYLDDTFTPFLLADQHGVVHAFVSQWVENVYRRHAVVYRQWTLMGGWTRPVDIILAPTGDADFLSAYLDSSSILHLIFMAGEAGNISVYYSQAPAIQADWAPAWSEPTLIGESASRVNSASIMGDDQGNLLVIYSGYRDGSGVYSVRSTDGGENWSEPSPVFLTSDMNLVPFSLRLAMGPGGQVRAAWNVVTSLGVDETLYFANYEIADFKWGMPDKLDSRINLSGYFGPSYPAIVDTGDNIIVLYNGGNPYAGQFVDPGRPVMRVNVSSDGGLTWNGPFSPFPLLNGRSGEHALTKDSLGIAHGLFVMRIDRMLDGQPKPVGGIWHSAFRDNGWTNPDRFVTTYTPHDIRATVSQGNVLLAVWREDPGAGEHGVWFAYRILDAPELPIIPWPSATANNSVQKDTTAIPSPNIATPVPESYLINDSYPTPWINRPALSLIIGIIPVTLVVLAMIVVYANRRGK